MTDATQVRVGVTGAVYVADTDATLPTDASTAVDAGFNDAGYISDDGITESHDDETESITAWQNGDEVRRIRTGHSVSWNFTFIETSATTLAEFYGNFTAGDGTTTEDTVEITGEELPHRAWVFDVVDGDNVLRIVVPDGQVTERGDVTYSNGEAVGREVTVTAFPDSDGLKATVYMAEVVAA